MFLCQSVLVRGWYNLPPRDILLRLHFNHWTSLIYTEPRTCFPRIRVNLCPSAGHIFPLIALINTDIPCFCGNPCSSVVGIIFLRETSFYGYILTTELHWTTLNQEYLFALRSAQKESFEPLGEIRNLNYLNQVYLFSWDSLDLCKLASKDVKFPRIRANPCPSVGHIFPLIAQIYTDIPCIRGSPIANNQ